MLRFLAPLLVLFPLALVLADGPGDNLPDKVRPIPPAGITLEQKQKEALKTFNTLYSRLQKRSKLKIYKPV